VTVVDPMLDTPAAARELGLAPQTLCNKRSRGGGPPFVKLDGAVRYRLADLERWKADNTHVRTPVRRKAAS
jgi:hypothetical protein